LVDAIRKLLDIGLLRSNGVRLPRIHHLLQLCELAHHILHERRGGTRIRRAVNGARIHDDAIHEGVHSFEMDGPAGGPVEGSTVALRIIDRHEPDRRRQQRQQAQKNDERIEARFEAIARPPSRGQPQHPNALFHFELPGSLRVIEPDPLL
jgi:hypothetical protein